MTQRHVLVVDDEAVVRAAFVEALAEAGFRAEEASGGAEALVLVKEREFDVLVIDLEMPGMDGFRLMQRAKKANSAAVCIITSAYGTISEAVKAVKLGAFDFMLKPLTRAELCKRVAEAASVKRRLGELEDLRRDIKLK